MNEKHLKYNRKSYQKPLSPPTNLGGPPVGNQGFWVGGKNTVYSPKTNKTTTDINTIYTNIYPSPQPILGAPSWEPGVLGGGGGKIIENINKKPSKNNANLPNLTSVT